MKNSKESWKMTKNDEESCWSPASRVTIFNLSPGRWSGPGRDTITHKRPDSGSNTAKGQNWVVRSTLDGKRRNFRTVAIFAGIFRENETVLVGSKLASNFIGQ
jgi:hypothetical protein